MRNRESSLKAGRRHEALAGLLFAAPAILGFGALSLFPMVASLVYSLTDYTVFNTPKFIGVENYLRLFSGADPFFYKSLQVTFYYAALSVPLGIVFAFALALALHRNIAGRGAFRTIFYLPTIMPAVATAVIWLWLLNPDFGLVNQLLTVIGLPTSAWLFSEETVIPSITLMSLWGTGGMMVIFLAGLEDIPRVYYEALDMDGGSPLHKLVYVTLPLCSSSIFFNAVMAIIGAFQTFTQAFILTQGGPNNASLFYMYNLYREAFRNANMGFASALAWVLFVVILAFTSLVFRSSKLWVFYEGERRNS